MLESTQHTKKIDLNYYVINRQWFRVAYIILCNLQNINSQVLPTKALSLIINQRKDRK